MRVLLSRTAVRRVVQSIQFSLLAASLAVLGYCAFVWLDAWRFQRNESQRLDEILLPPSVFASNMPAAASKIPLTTGLVGRLEIERLGIAVMVMEGDSASVLRRAAGHIAGTHLPGEVRNIGISAHRDTFFRPLRNVRKNDSVSLTTPAGNYVYRVVSTSIVEPEDVSVLNDTGEELLTLVTCYPFYFVGAAPQRFIVRAERIKAPAL